MFSKIKEWFLSKKDIYQVKTFIIDKVKQDLLENRFDSINIDTDNNLYITYNKKFGQYTIDLIFYSKEGISIYFYKKLNAKYFIAKSFLSEYEKEKILNLYSDKEKDLIRSYLN